MREIAAAADINDALLYRHFESKAQLFDEAVYTPLEQTVAHSFAPASSEEDIKDVAGRFLEELLAWMREILPLLTVVLADSERGQAFYRDRLRPALDDVAAATRANFGRWDHREFDPDMLIRLAWGGCWFLALDERFGETPVALEAAVPPLLDIIWNGVRGRSQADHSG